MSSSPINLLLTTKMFEEDNYQLVDYQSQQYEKNTFEIKSSGIIYEQMNQIYFSEIDNNEELEPYELFTIKLTNNEYILNIKTITSDLLSLSHLNPLYFVLKGNKLYKNKQNEKYKLNENDIFKIGKLYIKIRKIVLNTNNKSLSLKRKKNQKLESQRNYQKNNSMIITHNLLIENNNNPITKNSEAESIQLPLINKINLLKLNKPISQKKIKNNSDSTTSSIKKLKIKKKNKKICRICYCSKNKKENPLIYPCKCDGSMKYIHYKCLKNWINSKIFEENSKDDSIITYNEQILKCELCQENFPEFIELNGEKYNLIFHHPHFKEYVILESIRFDNYRVKYFHIISFDKRKTISIGRDENCDLSCVEVSISKKHCFLKKEGSYLYLEDNKSKFGTLVVVQNKEIKIIPYTPLKIQINNCYLKLNLKMKNSLFSCCCANEIGSFISYNKQNEKAVIVKNDDVVKRNYELEDEEKVKKENNKVKDIKIKRIKIRVNKFSDDYNNNIIKIPKKLINNIKMSQSQTNNEHSIQNNTNISLLKYNESINSEIIFDGQTY